mmetsp:Transcript_19812/g.60046  ORF Transcript_19812/g.60046 Transcript_19812/m.60046 type:complete len:339 (-) Transcript_19812:270-1286(-)
MRFSNARLRSRSSRSSLALYSSMRRTSSAASSFATSARFAFSIWFSMRIFFRRSCSSRRLRASSSRVNWIASLHRRISSISSARRLSNSALRRLLVSLICCARTCLSSTATAWRLARDFFCCVRHTLVSRACSSRYFSISAFSVASSMSRALEVPARCLANAACSALRAIIAFFCSSSCVMVLYMSSMFHSLMPRSTSAGSGCAASGAASATASAGAAEEVVAAGAATGGREPSAAARTSFSRSARPESLTPAPLLSTKSRTMPLILRFSVRCFGLEYFCDSFCVSIRKRRSFLWRVSSRLRMPSSFARRISCEEWGVGGSMASGREGSCWKRTRAMA